MKIEYETTNGGFCFITCPFIKGVKVGSIHCEEYCDYFISRDVANKVVDCNYKN